MIRAALVAPLVLLVAGACSDRGSPPTPTPSAQPTATPEVRAPAEPRLTASPKAIPQGAVTPVSPTPPSATPTPLPRTRPPTGNPTADAALAAIEARDVDALVALMTLELERCVTTRDLGDPVECPPTVAAGTPLEVFSWTHCEGRSRPRESAAGALGAWLESVQSIHGAYRVTSPTEIGNRTAGVFIVVSAEWPGEPEHAQHLFFDDEPGRATWVALGCVNAVGPYTADLARRGFVELLGVPVAP